MKRTQYGGQKPQELQIADDALTMRIRLDIQAEEQEIANGETTETQTQYSALEIMISAPFTKSKAIEQFFSDMYGNDHESKLINEYNSATIGLYSEPEKSEKIAKYRSFLVERATLKAEIERICTANNIL